MLEARAERRCGFPSVNKNIYGLRHGHRLFSILVNDASSHGFGHPLVHDVGNMSYLDAEP